MNHVHKWYMCNSVYVVMSFDMVAFFTQPFVKGLLTHCRNTWGNKLLLLLVWFAIFTCFTKLFSFAGFTGSLCSLGLRPEPTHVPRHSCCTERTQECCTSLMLLVQNHSCKPTCLDKWFVETKKSWLKLLEKVLFEVVFFALVLTTRLAVIIRREGVCKHEGLGQPSQQNPPFH